MSTRPPYSSYKSSGIDWLGDVPEHWDAKPIKYSLSLINGAPFKPAEWSSNGIPIIRIENLNGGQEFNYFDGEMPSKYIVHDGELLFGWSGNRGTSFGPFRWWGKGQHYLNQHIFRMVGYSHNKEWLYWTLRAVTHIVEQQAHGMIGLVHITKGKLGSIKIPSIPLPEQHAIADFLDHQTAKIDTLIAKKKDLIALLKEKRQAVITQAVTQGLIQNVPMKDSGIDWLGEVPGHWEVVPVRWYVSIGSGEFLSNEESTDEKESDNQYPAVGGNGILGYTNKINTPGNSVVVGRVGAYCGNVHYLNQPTWVTDNALRIRIQRDFQPRYLAEILRTLDINRWSNQNAQPLVTGEMIKSKLIPLPSSSEQQAIIGYLDHKTPQIDELLVKVEDAINKLKEYRTALITAAVTGKMDVRGEKNERIN
ncbi:restriction endonuclease subunit S [Candidatus Neomarinimicrobiota bacterium]